jgi:hypothetical protein
LNWWKKEELKEEMRWSGGVKYVQAGVRAVYAVEMVVGRWSKVGLPEVGYPILL